MKNSADQGGCYPQKTKAEEDNTPRDLQNSSYPTKAEFNACFIIRSKYFSIVILLSVFPLTKIRFSRSTVQYSAKCCSFDVILTSSVQ